MFSNKFYDNIVYKKNAVMEFEEYMRDNGGKRKVLCVFSKDFKLNNSKAIIDVLNKLKCEFTIFTFLDGQKIDSRINEEILMLKRKNFSFIVGGGNGIVSDLAKLISKSLDCGACFFPTLANSLSYFDDKASVMCGGVKTQQVVSKFNKLFIDESIVQKCGVEQVGKCVEYLSCFASVVIEIQFSSLVFNKSNQGLADELILTLKNMFKSLESSFIESEKTLIVFDNLLEVARIVLSAELESQTFINLANIYECLKSKKNEKTDFVQLCVEANNFILSLYKNFFDMKKIQIFEFDNIRAKENIVKNFNIFIKNHNYYKKTQFFYKNSLFFKKINAIKNRISEKIDEVSKTFVFKDGVAQARNTLTFDEKFKCIAILPSVLECSTILDTISAVGLLNVE